MPAHLTCLLRNLYAGQEATVRTGHRTMDWFKTGKGVSQGSILSPCLFNLNAEYIMWNARLDEAQAGIKINKRHINNLRYADDTTLYFFPFIFISWRLITLQYCSGFCHTLTWISYGFTCIPHTDPLLPPPSPPNPSGSSQCTRPEHLSYASSLGWWPVSP